VLLPPYFRSGEVDEDVLQTADVREVPVPVDGKPAGGVKVHTWNGRHARLTRAAANEMTGQ